MSVPLNLLFGNVDERGRLENLDLAELEDNFRNSDVLGDIFGGKILGVGDIDQDDDDEIVGTPAAVSTTIHNADAEDYFDINEVAEDDQTFLERNRRPATSHVSQPRSHFFTRMKDNFDEDYDDEDINDAKKIPVSTTQESFQSAKPFIINPQIHQTEASLPTSFQLQTPPVQEPITPTFDIKAIYPAFERGKILKFSELFAPRFVRSAHLKAKKITTPNIVDINVKSDDRPYFERFLSAEEKARDVNMKAERLGVIEMFGTYQFEDSEDEDINGENRRSQEELVALGPKQWHTLDSHETYYSVMLDSWEDDIVWDIEEQSVSTGKNKEIIGNATKVPHRNHDLEDGEWLNAVVWDERKAHASFTQLTLNLNDTNMLFDFSSLETVRPNIQEQKITRKGKKGMMRTQISKTSQPSEAEVHSKLGIDRFNLSNDRYYEVLGEGSLRRVRQTFAALVVQHSLPALKLQVPFYKTKLSKQELRSWHRPSIVFPTNTTLQFSKAKTSKKKKNKKKDEAIRSSKELSVKDNCFHILLEYSEEHPPIISNIGMGCFLVNYYRKKDDVDTHQPQLDVGLPVPLEIKDESPFKQFGNVEPGQTTSAMVNNIVRAPVFEHKIKETDFLLVKNTYKGLTKYYLREIPKIFVIGQTYPQIEVPGPHARRITNTAKYRFQVAAYRLIRKNPFHRLKVHKLAKQFPEYNDAQVRQRLKEFAEFNRKNKEIGGYWKLKANNPLPTEEELRKMVTPEMVCLAESMAVGERHLQDFGYGDVGEEDEDGENKLEVEQQLAPWLTTKNFVWANQGKAMLKLHGPGDPTGRGEGFSMIRVSMKDIFLKAGESAEEVLAEIKRKPKSAHRYSVAEQQVKYREEIARIWKAQYDSLLNPEEPALDAEEDEEEASEYGELDSLPNTPHNMDLDVSIKREHNMDFRNPSNFYSNPHTTPSPSVSTATASRYRASSEDDEISVTGSYSGRGYGNAQNKILTIKRLVLNEYGEKVWEEETVQDTAVINAYLRQRQMIEEEMTEVEVLEPTDDREKNERMKKRIQDQLAKLKRNAERRRQRQQAKQAALAENPVLGLMRGKKEGLVRKCGNCGQLGHMKTNKACPMFNKVYVEGAIPNASSAPVSGNFTTPDEDNVDGVPRISIPKAIVERTLSESPIESSMPLTFKVPASYIANPAAPKRKRSDMDQDYIWSDRKSYGPRRRNPEVELQSLIEKILQQISTIPDISVFLIPVSMKEVPDYYQIVVNPKDLGMIRDANRNFHYKSINHFMSDLNMIVTNSILYNGENSHLTDVARTAMAKAEAIIQENAELLKKIEADLGGEISSNMNPGNSSTSASPFGNSLN